ncbi:hypothetical protein OHS59_14490 [Streptomyces sp. NBC_00414]|uniref:hypothetical protein n=1 Tax=Streptomyces sp. NBC_00414 TaxID=2975739 RepID=UPI002E1A79CE
MAAPDGAPEGAPDGIPDGAPLGHPEAPPLGAPDGGRQLDCADVPLPSPDEESPEPQAVSRSGARASRATAGT